MESLINYLKIIITCLNLLKLNSRLSSYNKVFIRSFLIFINPIIINNIIFNI